MPHSETIVGGKKWPSVTEILACVSPPEKTERFMGWAAKHGTAKATAVLSVCDVKRRKNEDSFAAVERLLDEAGYFKTTKIQKGKFWFNHKKLQEEAVNEGRLFHDGIEQSFKEGFREDDKWGQAVKRWKETNKFEALEFERKVISHKHKYGGTFDCLGRIKDTLVLVDWKRSNNMPRSHVLQLAGYAAAYYEQEGKYIYEGRIVRPYQLERVAKEDSKERNAAGNYVYSFEGSSVKIEEAVYPDLSQYFPKFLAAKEIWSFLNVK